MLVHLFQVTHMLSQDDTCLLYEENKDSEHISSSDISLRTLKPHIRAKETQTNESLQCLNLSRSSPNLFEIFNDDKFRFTIKSITSSFALIHYKLSVTVMMKDISTTHNGRNLVNITLQLTISFRLLSGSQKNLSIRTEIGILILSKQ